ncbi:MAG: FMN-binding negative transcriptional regulator [Alphaproteobacteria bacterium]|nr:FMN-binding negative transcriptional regulator [Alphaproteobacteria bacterium]
MYIPDAFAETGLDRLHSLIEAYDFAMLITNGEPAPTVSHLPFVLDRENGPNGTLQAHMARSNPHWQSFAGEALVVFRGPHSYISPTWYEPDAPAVPTWNYAVVEAYGTPRIVDDAQQLRAQQERLVATHEAGRSPSWTMADQPPAYIDAMLRGIVAFEIPIARLEGKFKLNQNRSTTDRQHVAQALATGGSEDGQALARLMSAN